MTAGKVRRISGEWRLHDLKSRDTLLPCPACRERVRVNPDDDTKACRWCSGIGGVTKRVWMAFDRWKRIYGVNKRAGRC